MSHRFSDVGIGASLIVGLVLLQSAAAAAPQPAANPTYGRWSEKDISNLDFEIRPGAKPDQLMLVIPASVTFPGSHQFILTKRADGGFEATDPGRPKVSLSFQSTSKAKLQVRGHGPNWISMNDYTLVRR